MGQPSVSFSFISYHGIPLQSELQMRPGKCSLETTFKMQLHYLPQHWLSLQEQKSGNGITETTARTEEAPISAVRNTTKKNIRWNHSEATVVLASWLSFPKVLRPRFYPLLPKDKYKLTPFLQKYFRFSTAANWRSLHVFCLTPSLWGEKRLKAYLWLNSSSNLLGCICEDKWLCFASSKNICF